MSTIRVGRPHISYREHDLLTSCACTDLRARNLRPFSSQRLCRHELRTSWVF